ncbi:MAG: bifunctional 2-C-methyl-D-erythritol 4-phosphate cytidylyltransferase/2-C-methyl-D-erythritol 2,4-cyclodiphosphate synthase [Rhodospirillales bacterium]
MAVEDCIALIVAAGKGARLGGAVAKQYRKVNGQTILRLAVERSITTGQFAHVAVVIAAGDEASYREAVDGLSLLPPIMGGDTRRQSVLNGLESLAARQPILVAIQDAARPLVHAGLVASLIEQASRHGGAIAALQVVDTLKRGRDTIAATVARDRLWQAQTPQVFRFTAILEAHREAARLPQAERDALTDDAQVAERAGIEVALVQGSPDNFKITSEADLHRLETILQQREIRIGTGFDVHAFGDGDHVMLCGVKVAHERGLVGHSDADVGLHALTDALLGSVGFGDIGQHFPPSDPRWRGAASRQFVEHAAWHVRGHGGRIVNVDVTLICEQPKIGPHRQAMIAVLAEMLQIDPDRISVKATTTEKLGFTGRGEGIAAQAAVSVELPRGR